MSTPVGYPKEVWEALKTLWESVPKISVSELRRQVGDSMSCSMPDTSVISRRIKTHNWKKIVRRTAKNTVNSLVTTDKNNDNDETRKNPNISRGQALVIDGDCAEVFSESDCHNYPLDPTPVFNEAKRILKGVEKTIANHRLRNSNLGEMQDTLVEQFEDVLDVKLDTTSDDFESEAKKLVTALRVLQLKTGVLTDLAIANKAIQSSDRESWGIESSGDDSTNELRKVDSSILDKKLSNNRAALTKQKEEYVQEKMKRIESGEIFNSEKHD